MTSPLRHQNEQLSAGQSAHRAPGDGPAGYLATKSAQIRDDAPASATTSIRKPLGWFIINWLFFWPTAIYSLTSHWSKIDSAARAGDVRIAQLHARMVRDQAIIAVCLVVGAVIAYSIFFVVMLQLSVDYSNTH